MKKIEKIIIFFLLTLILGIICFNILLYKGYIDLNLIFNQSIKAQSLNKYYEVYQNDKYINKFETYELALEYAKKYKNTSIKKAGEEGWVYDSIPIFNVYVGSNDWFMAFDNIIEAIEYAKKYGNSDIFNRKTNKVVWSNKDQVNKSHLIQNVGYIGQYPELYRGCEVTSLAMLMNYKGINVSKMTLAEEIKKDATTLKIINGIKYYGNPNFGFVGDIYSSKNDGLGVYHGPIYELLQQYIGDFALDLTGISFEDLYYYIDNDIPVWIIINTWFEKLPESKFETWVTEQGTIKITYSEHSVLVTGYDENYIYYNDPMYPDKTYKKNKTYFIEAFKQMGSQAVTYYE